MPSDTELAKGVAVGNLSSLVANNANTIAEIQRQRSRRCAIIKATADAMASTTTAETWVTDGLLDGACRLYKAFLVCTGAGITADAANNAAVTVSKRDSAGANKTTLLTFTTNIAFGNVTQNVPKSLAAAVSASTAVDVTALSTLTWEVAKNGTGVVVPVSFMVLYFEDT
jgi:hypothetical protein